MSLDETSL